MQYLNPLTQYLLKNHFVMNVKYVHKFVLIKCFLLMKKLKLILEVTYFLIRSV